MALVRLRPVHEEDPADVIRREVGDLSGFEIAVQGVLVATYIRPETKTEGGILLSHETSKEDRYQSKIGLVLKTGNRAFTDDGDCKFHGFKAEPGDWVFFKASDGMRCEIPGPGGRDCRLISDVFVKMRVPHPDSVF